MASPIHSVGRDNSGLAGGDFHKQEISRKPIEWCIVKVQNLLKTSIIIILLGIIYYPMFCWVWERWNATESYYSHGPLIIITSLFIVWVKKKELKKLELQPSNWGIVLVALGLLLHLSGIWAGVYFVSGFSFILAITGLIMYFFGKRILKEIWFPVTFLLFMVPLPLVIISDITFKMKMFATHGAVLALNKIGITSIQEGSTIKMPYSYLIVEGQCSGLKYLISLLAFGAAFAYLIRKNIAVRWMLFLSSIPIALLANIFRIVLMGWVSDVFGMEAAHGWFHDFSGFLLFFFAAVGFLVVNNLLTTQVKIDTNTKLEIPNSK
ncbi:MAG: exosortase/archaeosortase family protein [Candidatus Omnitrophica bacterium]|nr:exosortase/archaeosortase family protein [Candidatus Omnitrophota bacterium]MCG2711132.1 exosortase/archaeosortase family protein [Candidatus Omnitrophota bacterium]